MDLSIITISWNIKEYLRECLKSIIDTVHNISFETIVVDNNSSDDTIQMIRNEFSSVRLIENKENCGFATANNQALKHARGEYILFLNPDTIMTPRTVNGIVDFLKNNPKAGIATCRKIDENGNHSFLDHFFLNEDPFSFKFHIYLRSTILRILSDIFPNSKRIQKAIFDTFVSDTSFVLHSKTHPIETNFSSGCFMMVKRKAVEEAGYFDERFFLEEEDIDLCYRIKKAGWEIYICPQYEIVHLGQKSIGQWNRGDMESIRTYSHFLFYSKYKGKTRLLFRVLKIMGTKAVLNTIFLISRPIIYIKNCKNMNKDVFLMQFDKESTNPIGNLLKVFFNRPVISRNKMYAKTIFYFSSIIKQIRKVKSWMRHNSPRIQEEIIKELNKNGFKLVNFHIDVTDYRQYLNNAKYHKFLNYYKGGKANIVFVEKSLEHYLAAELLDLSEDDVYIDVASANSPIAEIYHELYGCNTYRQDLAFTEGINGNIIGGDAGNMPVKDGFATKMALHCSFEHFEQDSDIRFIKEANRILRKNGKLCILPLYLSSKYTILTDPAVLPKTGISFEKDAVVRRVKNYRNRHGRHYDIPHFIDRIRHNLNGLRLTIYVVQNEKEVDPSCYVKFIALFEKKQPKPILQI